MKMKKVLLFPSGTEIAFEIVNALKYSKFVELYGATSIEDHSQYVYKRLFNNVPFITENTFLDRLNEIVTEQKIDCIFPAHDAVSLFLSQHREDIKTEIICTDFDTVKICRSKELTYQFFKAELFVPKIFKKIADVEYYPVFVKPKIGEGSKGTALISNKQQLVEMVDNKDEYLICEYLPGQEYTIDCFTDKNKNLRIVKMRERERLRLGISVRSTIKLLDGKVEQIANILNARLSFRGAWFFQVKKDIKGNYKLLEISPRIPGTMGVSRNCGINFPMLTLFDYWGYDVKFIDNNYKITGDRAFYTAYKLDINYTHIYLDYDDTLIIGNKVNEQLMFFLYQALNYGKKIYLLSRHSGNLNENMRLHKISPDIFEGIFILKDGESKSHFIKNKDAIFIDDSFSERFEVYTSLGIPVFDLDMVESLIDWRR